MECGGLPPRIKGRAANARASPRTPKKLPLLGLYNDLARGYLNEYAFGCKIVLCGKRLDQYGDIKSGMTDMCGHVCSVIGEDAAQITVGDKNRINIKRMFT